MNVAEQAEHDFPVVGNQLVDNRVVGENIPNTSSIGASFTAHRTLPGIREVRIDQFEDAGPPAFYSASEKSRTERLAQEIARSGRIDPLIVAIDDKGPYILEGGHRFDALKLLGAKSFPAMVVIDEDAPVQALAELAERGKLPAAAAADVSSPVGKGAGMGSVRAKTVFDAPVEQPQRVAQAEYLTDAVYPRWVLRLENGQVFDDAAGAKTAQEAEELYKRKMAERLNAQELQQAEIGPEKVAEARSAMGKYIDFIEGHGGEVGEIPRRSGFADKFDKGISHVADSELQGALRQARTNIDDAYYVSGDVASGLAWIQDAELAARVHTLPVAQQQPAIEYLLANSLKRDGGVASEFYSDFAGLYKNPLERNLSQDLAPPHAGYDPTYGLNAGAGMVKADVKQQFPKEYDAAVSGVVDLISRVKSGTARWGHPYGFYDGSAVSHLLPPMSDDGSVERAITSQAIADVLQKMRDDAHLVERLPRIEPPSPPQETPDPWAGLFGSE